MFRPGWLEALRREAEKREAEPEQWCPHEPTAKQAEFLKLDCLEALYGGAAGGGKSDALLMDALRFVDQPGYHAILFRKTYTDLALPGAIMQRAHVWLAGTSARWNDRDKVFVFPSGARLAFGYLDGPRDHFRYQSAEFQFIGFDELTHFPEQPYRYLFSRLRRRAGSLVPLRMRAATNPGGIGHEWVKRRFLDEPEDRVFIPAKLIDNPHSDQDEYQRALDQLDPITRQQLRDGVWVQDTTGLVYFCFTDHNIAGSAVLPELEPGESWMRVLGCDFGVTDPTAFVELAFAEHHPVVYVTRSGQWTDLAPSGAAEVCIEWERDVAGGYDAIVGDTGGLGKGFEAEWTQRFAIPMRAASKADKLGYIKLLNGDLHHRKLVILPGNDQLVMDLRVLAWKDENHRLEHPSLPNHLTDALLYGWREARHWAWEEREQEQLTAVERSRYDQEFRKQRKRDRIRRAAEEDETGLPSGWSNNEEYGIDGD